MKNIKHSLWVLIALFGITSCFPDPKPQRPELNSGNPAIVDATQLMIDEPDDPLHLVARSGIYYDQEDYEKAAKDMEEAVALDPENLAFRHLLADIYFDGEMDADMTRTLEAAIEKFPDSEPTYLKLAEMQMIIEMYEPALGTIKRLKKVSPDLNETNYLEGLVYNEMGKLPEAEKSLLLALKNEPEHFDANFELGLVYEKMNNSKTLKYLDKALDLEPSHPDVMFAKGSYLKNKGNTKAALDLYKQIVLIDPTFADAHLNSGIIWLEKNDLGQARNHFNMAIESDPTFPQAYYFRGLVNALQGRKEPAQSDFEQALNLSPGYEEAKEALEKLAAEE